MARKTNPTVAAFEKQARLARSRDEWTMAVAILTGLTKTYERRLVQDAQDALQRVGGTR